MLRSSLELQKRCERAEFSFQATEIRLRLPTNQCATLNQWPTRLYIFTYQSQVNYNSSEFVLVSGAVQPPFQTVPTTPFWTLPQTSVWISGNDLEIGDIGYF